MNLEVLFYSIALSATAVLIVQTIMSLIGLGNDQFDFDSDSDISDGFDSEVALDLEDIDTNNVDIDNAAGVRFFTIRGIVAFFSIFGWVGVIFYKAQPIITTLAIASGAGFSAMIIVSYLFYGMTKLQSSGNISYNNAIGQMAEVYLRIPEHKKGKGKIVLTLQERMIEMSALTLDDEIIASGEQVEVIDVLPDHTAIVRRV